VPHRPLLHAISAESLARISDAPWRRSAAGDALQSFAQFILSVAWSFSFLRLLTPAVLGCFEGAVRQLGAQMDATGRGGAGGEPGRGARGGGGVGWIHTRSGIKPTLLIDLPGMATIYKPTDWEVDGFAAGDGSHPPLSAYTQSIFPEADFPLVWDEQQNYGFLHRLDIPSSGLVLSGTTSEGYYCLRLQLDTQRLRREYAVVCQGLARATLVGVTARVDVAPDPSQRKSINDSGKPSQTQVVVGAHIAGFTGLEEGRMCITVIRIFTGRRHQIRVHMRHCSHPSVADARYTCREVLALGGGRPGAGAGGGRRPSGARWTYNAVGL